MISTIVLLAFFAAIFMAAFPDRSEVGKSMLDVFAQFVVSWTMRSVIFFCAVLLATCSTITQAVITFPSGVRWQYRLLRTETEKL
jgi:hypothetical protein